MPNIKRILSAACISCAVAFLTFLLAGCQLSGEAGTVSGEESSGGSNSEETPISSASSIPPGSSEMSSSGPGASQVGSLPDASAWVPVQQSVTLANGRVASLSVETTAPINSRDQNTEYVLNCRFAGQTDCFPLGKRTYGNAFSLSVADYNNDGNPDFALGEYNSASGNLFRIFSIYPDGTIRALSKPFFAFSTNFSPAFSLSETPENAFQIVTFDKELQQRVRGTMCWDENNSFYFQFEENIPSDSTAKRSDGITALYVTVGEMNYHLTQPEIDAFLALLAQVGLEPLSADRVGELSATTCTVTIEQNDLQNVLELPYFLWNGVPQRAAEGAQELVDFLSEIPCFHDVDLLPAGFAIGRSDGIHRISLLASGGGVEILLDESEFDAFLASFRQVELKPVRTPKDTPVNEIQLSIESDDGQQIYFLPNWEDTDGYFYTAVAGQDNFFAYLSQFSGIPMESLTSSK